MIRQKTEIENCGYIIAQNKIRRLIDNDSLKSQMSLIKIIRTFLADKEEDIRQAVGQDCLAIQILSHLLN